MENKSMKKGTTLRGVVWSLCEVLTGKFSSLIIGIVLARLLLPEDFGLVGMITVFISMSYAIVDGGFSQALIREQNPTQEDYSTVFYFNFLVSAFLYMCLFFSANIISNFYEEPRLVMIIRVLPLVLVINALSITQRTMLIKNVDFKTQAKVTTISAVVSGIVTIAAAFSGCGVWSLVISQISMQSCQTFLLWVYNRWLPSLVFSLNSFKRLFGFGSKLLISAFINNIYVNLYSLIIGKLYTAVDLGFYSNAAQPRDIIMDSYTSAIDRVTYPILADIRDDDEILKENYRRTIKMTMFVYFPIMLGMVAVAEQLFPVLFGAKWLPSVPYFKLLCISGLFYPLNSINLNIIKVKGRADLYLKLEIYKKIIFTANIFIFIRWGIIGLLYASILSNVLGYVLNAYYSGRLISYSALEQVADIFPSFAIAVFMEVAVNYSVILMPQMNIIRLIFQIIAGIVIYITVCKLFRLKEMELVLKSGAGFLKKAI